MFSCLLYCRPLPLINLNRQNCASLLDCCVMELEIMWYSWEGWFLQLCWPNPSKRLHAASQRFYWTVGNKLFMERLKWPSAGAITGAKGPEGALATAAHPHSLMTLCLMQSKLKNILQLKPCELLRAPMSSGARKIPFMGSCSNKCCI